MEVKLYSKAEREAAERAWELAPYASTPADWEATSHKAPLLGREEWDE